MARPRSKQAHDKVIEAALTLFAERGLDSTSMDGIAEASGVSKATIYKHWQNKNALCLEALSLLFGSDVKVPVADTGDLHCDLVQRLSHQPAPDRAHLRESIMPHVAAYAAKEKEFGTAWRNRALEPLITALTQWIKREQKRGTLRRHIDMESAIALLVGPLVFRNIFHRAEVAPGKRFAQRLEAETATAFLMVHATKNV